MSRVRKARSTLATKDLNIDPERIMSACGRNGFSPSSGDMIALRRNNHSVQTGNDQMSVDRAAMATRLAVQIA